MKVTIYTINDCKFSQAEKDYLKTNNIAFEEKNVEQNRDFLTEMLGISENFAGTPVTKIDEKVLKKADIIVELPMFGINKSFNVWGSAAVIAYKILESLY